MKSVARLLFNKRNGMINMVNIVNNSSVNSVTCNRELFIVGN